MCRSISIIVVALIVLAATYLAALFMTGEELNRRLAIDALSQHGAFEIVNDTVWYVTIGCIPAADIKHLETLSEDYAIAILTEIYE